MKQWQDKMSITLHLLVVHSLPHVSIKKSSEWSDEKHHKLSECIMCGFRLIEIDGLSLWWVCMHGTGNRPIQKDIPTQSCDNIIPGLAMAFRLGHSGYQRYWDKYTYTCTTVCSWQTVSLRNDRIGRMFAVRWHRSWSFKRCSAKLMSKRNKHTKSVGYTSFLTWCR